MTTEYDLQEMKRVAARYPLTPTAQFLLAQPDQLPILEARAVLAAAARMGARERAGFPKDNPLAEATKGRGKGDE